MGAVSLSAHDRRTLGQIEEDLAVSAPHLAAMMSSFSRLADGEAMPGQERIQAGTRRKAGQPLHSVLGGQPGRPRWVVLTWLAVIAASAVLIGLALAGGRGGASASCAAWTVPACPQHTPAHRQGPPALSPQG
ncbi:MAG TPA: hypothetical protein VHF26_09260 [Trebonia sp.]|nr:hypothetical protein [Trebonia sp.]